MSWHFHDNPATTVAIALAAGMIAQAAGKHLRVPGIIVLLGLGVLLGPDALGLVEPGSLAGGLQTLVGFSVAVILFEGGLSLDLRRLRRSERPIRQLVTVGALTSMIAGAALASVAMGWGWRLALLFGTLVIVTGPTVVTPLLARLRVDDKVATVLEAEGVLIDAVGAITAVVALELVLSPSDTSFALAAPNVIGRLAFGATIGLVGGALLAGALRFRRVVPEGLENPFSLGWAILVFAVANAIWHESGIAAVTIAGMVVGNTRSHVSRELAEFKEQLTVMLIGMLFVLLVADVRIADVLALGWPGVAVAVGSILLVRPLSALAGTFGTDLDWRERAFVAWIGPRGIVAAAVASYFAYELAERGIAGGQQLRALVFTVIASTVIFSGATGGLVARWLGLRRPADDGWLVFGGNRVALELARALRTAGGAVIAMDDDPAGVRAHEEAGTKVVHGNALSARTLRRARLGDREGAIAVTANEEVNFLFCETSRAMHRDRRFVIALSDFDRGVTPEMVDHLDGERLGATEVDVLRWSRRLDSDEAEVVWFGRAGGTPSGNPLGGDAIARGFFGLAHRRGDTATPVTDRTEIEADSELAVVLDVRKREEVEREMASFGFYRLRSSGTDLPATARAA